MVVWDTDRVAGPVLYRSDPDATANVFNDGVPFQNVTFDVGGLNLAPGAQCVAFLSVYEEMDGVFESAVFGHLGVAFPGEWRHCRDNGFLI